MTRLRPSPSVLIRGDGVAAATCAHLLRKRGVQVRLELQARARVPAIMLGRQALGLLRDVFDQPDLLDDLPRIDRRVVAWGEAAPAALPHDAVVVSETLLHSRLAPHAGPEITSQPDLVLHAAPQPSSVLRRFGDRPAWAREVALRSPDGGCWIEAGRDGWLFLIPDGAGSAWLLAVGAPPETLLAGSRLIAPCIEPLDGIAGRFDPCPRLAEPTFGEGWLAIGGASIGFDPICGDGTAQAVRQGVLASAVVLAQLQGGEPAELRGHYEAVLTAAMRRHLRLSMDFYRSGGDGPWWWAQLDSLIEGHAWCTARLATVGDPAFELRDFTLVRRELAA